MNKQLRLRDGKIKTAYWSLVGVVAALLVSTQAVFAADMWDRFSMIIAVSCGICCKAKRKTTIIRRCINA